MTKSMGPIHLDEDEWLELYSGLSSILIDLDRQRSAGV